MSVLPARKRHTTKQSEQGLFRVTVIGWHDHETVRTAIPDYPADWAGASSKAAAAQEAASQPLLAREHEIVSVWHVDHMPVPPAWQEVAAPAPNSVIGV